MSTMDEDYRLNGGGDEITALDAMLNAAIEATGLDPATATVDDLIAWIRERRAEDWQPIETAPKDETIVDLWCDGKRYPNCSACANVWRGIADSIRQPPTHWRPLPKGPKA